MRRRRGVIYDEIIGWIWRGGWSDSRIRGGGGSYDGVTITTRKGRALHVSYGLLDWTVGAIIQATPGYRYKIVPMEGGANLSSASAPSNL